jgi:phage I-like protein
METPGQEVGKIETRLRQLGARLDRLLAKADAAGTELKVDYRHQVDLVREKHAAVHDRLRTFRAAKGRKWDDFRGGVETAWYEFENALKALEQ